MEILGRWLAIIVITIAVAAFLLALLRAKEPFVDAFESAVAIAGAHHDTASRYDPSSYSRRVAAMCICSQPVARAVMTASAVFFACERRPASPVA
jgi:hypothetical protein